MDFLLIRRSSARSESRKHRTFECARCSREANHDTGVMCVSLSLRAVVVSDSVNCHSGMLSPEQSRSLQPSDGDLEPNGEHCMRQETESLRRVGLIASFSTRTVADSHTLFCFVYMFISVCVLAFSTKKDVSWRSQLGLGLLSLSISCEDACQPLLLADSMRGANFGSLIVHK